MSTSTSPLFSLFPAREIQQATESDETLRALKDVILRGWPDPSSGNTILIIRDELSIQYGVIFRGQRMVIPSSLRRDMKQTLHASHLGVESCLRRARETIFWPWISNEIKEMIATCETCRKYETSNQKEQLPSTQSTMATSRSRPVRARPKAVHDNSGREASRYISTALHRP